MARHLSQCVGLCLLSAACGGGGGGGQESGVFLDSAVEGLGFVSGTLSGLTDADGTFLVDGGAPVTLSLGDILLGTAAAQPVVTPVDLVAGAEDEQHPTVTNLARFLQTLDADEDPDNGITIPAAVQQAAVGQTLSFAVSIAAFGASAQPVVDTLTAGLPGGARPLIAAVDAQAHLAATLLGVVAGRYDGTFGGTDSGDFSVFVDRAGNLEGWADSQFEGLLGLTGSVSSDGGFLAGVVSSGATFVGSISASGVLSGDWELPPLDSGTFSGVRTEGVDVTLDLGLLGPRVGDYVGTFTSTFETGLFQATLDASFNVSAPPPDDVFAGTVVSTSSGVAEFSGLGNEGSSLSGTITPAGVMTGSFQNPFEGETGTFTATLVP